VRSPFLKQSERRGPGGGTGSASHEPRFEFHTGKDCLTERQERIVTSIHQALVQAYRRNRSNVNRIHTVITCTEGRAYVDSEATADISWESLIGRTAYRFYVVLDFEEHNVLVEVLRPITTQRDRDYGFALSQDRVTLDMVPLNEMELDRSPAMQKIWLQSLVERYEELMPKHGYVRGRSPRRGNPEGNTFELLHADHGLSKKQLTYIEKVLPKKVGQGFFLQEIKLPTKCGKVDNGLYGPDSGDAPVPESEVHYRPRADRDWSDRMIDRPFRKTNKVQVIGIRDGNHFKLFTAYGGPAAPQNPADPGNRDPEGSRRWWSQHALATGRKKNAGRGRYDDMTDTGLRRLLAKKKEGLRKLQEEAGFAMHYDSGFRLAAQGYYGAIRDIEAELRHRGIRASNPHNPTHLPHGPNKEALIRRAATLVQYLSPGQAAQTLRDSGASKADAKLAVQAAMTQQRWRGE
jgi:hypothetical protein